MWITAGRRMMLKNHRQHFLRQKSYIQPSDIFSILLVFGSNLFQRGVRVLSDSLYSTNTPLSASRMFSWECLSAGGNVRYSHPGDPRDEKPTCGYGWCARLRRKSVLTTCGTVSYVWWIIKQFIVYDICTKDLFKLLTLLNILATYANVHVWLWSLYYIVLLNVWHSH